MSHPYRIALLMAFLLPALVRAQSTFVPLNADYYHLIDRLEIRRGRWSEGFHRTVKPYNRQGVVQLPHGGHVLSIRPNLMSAPTVVSLLTT